jgi:hypothetical protein
MYRFTGKSFRKAAALVAVMLAVVAGQGMATPASSPDYRLNLPAVSPEHFQACAYRAKDALKMRVHFVNPQQKRVKILILNSEDQTVFTRDMRKTVTFVGNLDLTGLPNGRYTIVIQSGNDRFTQPFTLHSQITRLVQVD